MLNPEIPLLFPISGKFSKYLKEDSFIVQISIQKFRYNFSRVIVRVCFNFSSQYILI